MYFILARRDGAKASWKGFQRKPIRESHHTGVPGGIPRIRGRKLIEEEGNFWMVARSEAE